jgi:hypothetical protein
MGVVPECIVEAELCVVKRQYNKLGDLLCLARVHYTPDAPCHNRTVPSLEAEAKQLPFGDQATS